MRSITSKQKQVYDFIVSFTTDHGYPPAIREICAAVGLKSPSSVHAHIKSLQEMGYIQKDDRKTRALVTADASSHAGKIPVLGKVTAGQPILAVEEVEEYLPYEPRSGSESDFFALRVQGDSMINAGILDGDYVIVRKQDSAMNGEIVVAMIEDQATVKRIRFENEDIWLMPENPEYTPIYAPECNILGVVKGLFRHY